MGDFEPDKGIRQAEHLIWSRRYPYAYNMMGRRVEPIEPLRPLPGASTCEGPHATHIAAVPYGAPETDLRIASWNPSDSVAGYFTVDEVDLVDPAITEGYFLNRGTLTTDDYPLPRTAMLDSRSVAREPALEDDTDSSITVPIHHNARLLRVDDTRQDTVYDQYPGEFPDQDWPPLPRQLADEPGYARNPCHAVIDCCEDPADPAVVRPTWFFNGVQITEIYQIFITSQTDRHVFMLESVYSPWTPAQIDADRSVLNRPDRPGFDERDPTFMARQRGNLITVLDTGPNEDSHFPINYGRTGDNWRSFVATVNDPNLQDRFDWALVEGETNLYRHSIFENHVFVQNHQSTYVDIILRNLTLPFRFDGGAGTPADPAVFQYGPDRNDRTQFLPFNNMPVSGGPILRMHLFRPRMRWWPYDAVDDPGGGAGYWRVEIPLIDFYDPVEAFEYLLSLVYVEDGDPMDTYDSGFVDISGSPPATWSDLLDLAISTANSSSSFTIERQPDSSGNAILHITRFDAPAGPGDTLDFNFIYGDGDEDFDIVNLFNIEEYQLPIIDSPKGWCFDAPTETSSVVIEGYDDFNTPGFARGIQYLDVWGNVMPPEWFDGTTREVGGTGGGTGPFFDELLVARVRVPITIPAGVWAIGFSWEYPSWDIGATNPPRFQVEHIFIPDGGPRCIPWMSPTGGSDCALGSLPQLD